VPINDCCHIDHTACDFDVGYVSTPYMVSMTSGLYYKPRTNNTKQAIKNHGTQVFEQIPIYGEKKVHQQLLEDGFKVSLNTVVLCIL
jgi:hypothetical protein